MRKLVYLLALAACHDGGTPSTPPPVARPVDAAVIAKTVPVDAAPAPPPLRDPHRWDCKVDGDCVNSCRWGAVSAAWYQPASKRSDFQECEDGCANQVSAPPHCEAGGCVAYVEDPRGSKKLTKASDCTRVEP
jgi:hypothetical protein